MKLPFKARTISMAVVIPSAIIVAALAVMEYRWSTRVSEATAVRLADSLQMSMMNWQRDFFRYFSEIGLALRIDPVEDEPGDFGKYVRRLAEWKAAAKYPTLVQNVYLLKLDAAAWPAAFEPFRGDLRRELPSAGNGFDETSASWRFEPVIPALLHPVITGHAASGAPRVDWIAIELNAQVIRTNVFADLSRTYFQGTDGLDYLVAVIANGAPGHVLYSSDAGFGEPEPKDADGTIDLFARARGDSGASPVQVFHIPADNKGPDPSAKISWFPFLRPTAAGEDWLWW